MSFSSTNSILWPPIVVTLETQVKQGSIRIKIKVVEELRGFPARAGLNRAIKQFRNSIRLAG